MARTRTAAGWLLLALLASAAFVARPAWASDEAEDEEPVDLEDDEYSDEEVPPAELAHLVIRKFTKDDADGEPVVVQGRNVTITIDIYNAGVSTASDVRLLDRVPAEATLMDGVLEASLGKISVGSHVKHSYTIVFNNGSIQASLPPAVVSYIPDSQSSAKQVGLSSVPTLYVMTPVQQIQRYALKVGVYASLGFARSSADWRNMSLVVGVIGALLGINWGIKKVGLAKTNRRREKALKDLAKDE